MWQMSEEKNEKVDLKEKEETANNQTTESTTVESTKPARRNVYQRPIKGKGKEGGRDSDNRNSRNRSRDNSDEKTSVLSLRRVTKVREGSNRLSFSALVVVGDMKGSLGIAAAKAREAPLSIQSAAANARASKYKITLLDNRTLPYDVEGHYCSTKVLLRKAKPGTGIVAGKIVRAILECLGGSNLDVVSKVYGSRNPINVSKAILEALSDFIEK